MSGDCLKRILRIDDPVRVGEEQLPDGRWLGWAEWGPIDGAPVLLSPGAATSRHLGFGAGAVADLGVRLICLDRPGLGASTPAAERTFADFAEDVRAFAIQRGLGRPAMVGHSQGAPFALACAAGGVIGALAVVSGADEIAAPWFADVLPEELRRLVDTAVADPVDAEEIFAGFTPEAMWDLVMAASPACDLAVYQQPAFAAAYRQALQEAFEQGPGGYVRDTVLAMGRWGIDLSVITVPVDLWYGEKDLSHSPDQGATLVMRIPGALRHIVPGMGGAVLWTHAKQILDTGVLLCPDRDTTDHRGGSDSHGNTIFASALHRRPLPAMTTPAHDAPGERADLLETLGKHRHFLRYTVRDLTDEQAAQRTTASELCLGGLIKHVTATERGWINFILDGPSALGPWDEAGLAAHAQGFRMLEGETLAGLIEEYEQVARSTDQLVSTLPDLDAAHPLPDAPWFEPEAHWSARRVLLHVIAETAQHAGHADIIREALDGAKTMG